MVKLAVTVFLSVAVVFVGCGEVPTVFQKEQKKDEERRICRLKGCFDESCEIMHCICQKINIEKILKRKQCDCLYPKEWLNDLYDGLKTRCFCLDGCKNMCNPSEHVFCMKAAFSRWNCYYDKIVKKYGKDPRFKHLSDDFRSLTAHCVNVDCKNNCVGNGRCKPYHRPACTKCLNEKLESIATLLDANYAKRLLHLHVGYLESYQSDLRNCQCYAHNKDQGIYQRCIQTAQEYMQMTCEKMANELVEASNSHCSTESIIALITNAVSECSYKFELDGGYPEDCYTRKQNTRSWGHSSARSYPSTNTFLSARAQSYSSPQSFEY